MAEEAPNARAQRPSRAEEVRAERRRKPGETTQYGKKLHVPKDKLDPAYEHRWVNDVGDRVQQLHDADWDRVTDLPAAGGEGVGTVPTKHVGTDSGKPIKAILMRKRKDWYEADAKEKRAPLDEMDKAIRGGTAHQKTAPELTGDVAYTPGGVNTIDRR